MTDLEIKTVAVVGAGISGVSAAAHLMRQGLSVTVYERMSKAGGIWVFDERVSHEQRYPNENPSTGDYERVHFEDEELYGTPPRTPTGEHLASTGNESLNNQKDAEIEDPAYTSIAHASPGPCYVNLKNNVSSTTSLKTTLGEWPAGLDEFVNQRYFEEYIRQIAHDHKVHKVTRYNTRVEDISKVGGKWRICTTTLVLPHQAHTPRGANTVPTHPILEKNITFFDAVVVASGRNHMPRIPNIPGLAEAKSRYPDRISHSKGHRRADKYRNCNVLIVGAGVSSVDITKEIVSVGGTVYQSSRGGYFDYPAHALPQGAHRVPGIERFVIRTSEDHNRFVSKEQATASECPHDFLPIEVKLSNGETLINLHYIIVATGYIQSYPFLADKHCDTISNREASDDILITREGDMVHNLYKDIFYIEDPTLSFVGIGVHISTFSFFEFQAQLVARVYSTHNSATLPSKEAMLAEYEEKVRNVGLGRDFHSYRWEDAETEYVADLVATVNRDLRGDEEPMLGHTEAFMDAYRKQREVLIEKVGREALQRPKR